MCYQQCSIDNSNRFTELARNRCQRRIPERNEKKLFYRPYSKVTGQYPSSSHEALALPGTYIVSRT